MNDIKCIARHIRILNEEVGTLQVDIKWIKRVIYYMAAMGTAMAGGILRLAFM